jgi:hypothetical protein
MERHEIKADWDTLFEQSKNSGGQYFASARQILEGSELDYTAADVVALAQVMMYDFRTSSIGVAAQKINEAITAVGWGLDNISEVMREGNDE